MKQIPNSVEEHIANARYYLAAADKHPSPTQDAAHIFFLLVAWENIAIADAELTAWAREEDVDKKIDKDHAHKFKDAPTITRIIVGPSGTKPREINFSSGRDLAELRMACLYGSNTESKDVGEIFKKGWHADDFRRTLINKIDWTVMWLKMYKEL